MNTWLNKNFGFSKSEFNGILVLLALIILLKAIPFGFEFFEKDRTEDKLTVEKIQKLALVENERYVYRKKEESDSRGTSHKIDLFTFDPNTINITDWQKLGLSAKQAQAILNYTSKGGKFYKPEDLAKMYTISPKMYSTLLPFIKIESNKGAENNKPSFSTESRSTQTFAKKEYSVVEINSADTMQLQQIKGIGPAFARRIFSYRERLGGFVSKQQLMEVYGLDSTKLREVESQIKIDLNAIKSININTADFETLKRFPYLTYKQINAIVQYRKQHGKYNGIDDLKKIAILTPLTMEKIAPYLSF